MNTYIITITVIGQETETCTIQGHNIFHALNEFKSYIHNHTLTPIHAIIDITIKVEA